MLGFFAYAYPFGCLGSRNLNIIRHSKSTKKVDAYRYNYTHSHSWIENSDPKNLFVMYLSTILFDIYSHSLSYKLIDFIIFT